MTAKVVDFTAAAKARGKLSLQRQRQLLLDLCASGHCIEARELAGELVIALHQAGQHKDAESLAVTGIPALDTRIRYGV